MTRPSLKPATEGATDNGGLYFTRPSASIDFVRSGSTLLDCVLGGGFALGRIANIIGDRSTGKTLLAMEAISNFLVQYPEGTAIYVEVEAAFDAAYAEALGVPVDKINFVEDVFTVEDWYRHIEDLLDQLDKNKSDNPPVIYVIDSLDALSDTAEMGRDIDKGSFGASKAKQLSEFFRRINKRMSEHNILLLIVSQVRDNINATFGVKWTRAGGRAIDFYASQILYLAQIKTHKKTKQKVERAVGVRVKAKCTKNKVSLPFRECEFDIFFGYGVDDLAANIEWLSAVERFSLVSDLAPDKYIKSLESLDDDAYFDEVGRVRDVVCEVWTEIETRFIPTRTKRR